jgi:uncharacterized protein (TIGR02284 family)
MNKEKTIEVLNTLIELHSDRIKGYETASDESEEEDLKLLFSQFIQFSQECNDALEKEIRKAGGIPIDGTTMSGSLFRMWMDVKYLLTCNDRYTILNSCEHGEGLALEIYTTILTDNLEDLSIEHHQLFTKQHGVIKTAHDHVDKLYNMSLAHE